MVHWQVHNKGRTVRLVTNEVKLSLVIISVSVTLITVMIVFGEINFFEGMTCEELEIFMTNELAFGKIGKYPFGTPFTPSQINDLKEQYEYQCTATLVDL